MQTGKKEPAQPNCKSLVQFAFQLKTKYVEKWNFSTIWHLCQRTSSWNFSYIYCYYGEISINSCKCQNFGSLILYGNKYEKRSCLTAKLSRLRARKVLGSIGGKLALAETSMAREYEQPLPCYNIVVIRNLLRDDINILKLPDHKFSQNSQILRKSFVDFWIVDVMSCKPRLHVYCSCRLTFHLYWTA